MIRCLLLIGFLAALVSCSTPGGMATSGSARGYVVDFLVEGGGMQYFVKPMPFEDDALDVELELDITFRIAAAKSDSATLNFTIVGEQAPKTIDSICIEANSACQRPDRVRTMFVERHDDDLHARYTSMLSQQRLFSLMTDPAWTFRVWSGQRTYAFEASTRARKAIATTYSGIVEPSLSASPTP